MVEDTSYKKKQWPRKKSIEEYPDEMIEDILKKYGSYSSILTPIDTRKIVHSYGLQSIIDKHLYSKLEFTSPRFIQSKLTPPRYGAKKEISIIDTLIAPKASEAHAHAAPTAAPAALTTRVTPADSIPVPSAPVPPAASTTPAASAVHPSSHASAPSGEPEKKKYVYSFKEGDASMTSLLGGKGANLAEMTRLGIPVPPGFTITTEAGKHWKSKAKKTITDQIEKSITNLESITQKQFGGSNPLLVSVRSGAKVSIPGMMDTILNIGLNDETVKALAAASGNPGFAYNSYERVIRMFSEVVHGMDLGRLDSYLTNKAYSDTDNFRLAFEYRQRKNPASVNGAILKRIYCAIKEQERIEIQAVMDKDRKLTVPSAETRVKLNRKAYEQGIYKTSRYGTVESILGDQVTVRWGNSGFKTETYSNTLLEIIEKGTEIVMNHIESDSHNYTKEGSEGTITDFINREDVMVNFTKLMGEGASRNEWQVENYRFFTKNPRSPEAQKVIHRNKKIIAKEIEKVKNRYSSLKMRLKDAHRYVSRTEKFTAALDKLGGFLKSGSKIPDGSSRDTKYAVGDTVIYYNKRDSRLGDMKGVVKCFEDGCVGVEWEKEMGGHSLSGYCKDGHGLWIDPYELKKVRSVPTLESIRESLSEKMLPGLRGNPGFRIELIKKYVEENVGEPFPQKVTDQLHQAIASVFKSWNNPHAIEYRKINNIPHDLGTAVNIQSMVFGNRTPDSFTGVAFSRDNDTGERKIKGNYLKNAQGEDVVSGSVTPLPLSDLEKDNPAAYLQLSSIIKKLEGNYRDMQDIEFTCEDGKLFILQTRNGKRTRFANVKMALDMVDEDLISPYEAVSRIALSDLDAVMQQTVIVPSREYVTLGNADTSCGVAIGKVALSNHHVREYADEGHQVILVKSMTDTKDIAAIHASEGILTAEGGSASHAAVVARGLNKVCLTGCKGMFPDKENEEVTFMTYSGEITVKEGDTISLDGNTGTIYKGAVKIMIQKENDIIKRLETVVSYVLKEIGTHRMLSVERPEDFSSMNDESSNIGIMNHLGFFLDDTSRSSIEKYLLKQDKRKTRTKSLQALTHTLSKKYAEMFITAAGKSDVIYCNLLPGGLNSLIPSTNGIDSLQRLSEEADICFPPKYCEQIVKRKTGVKTAMEGANREQRKRLDYWLIRAQVSSIIQGAASALRENPDAPVPIINIPSHLIKNYGRRPLSQLVSAYIQKEVSKADFPFPVKKSYALEDSRLEESPVIYSADNFIQVALERYHKNNPLSANTDTAKEERK